MITRQPKGVSLVETVVVVAISGIVLTTGVGMVHMVLGLDRGTRKSVHHSAVISRLSGIFRQDVHAATQFQLAPSDKVPAVRLQLQLPHQRTVAYEVSENRLARVEQADGKTRHQDQFIFPAGCHIEFQARQDPDRVAVSVRQAEDFGASLAGPTGHALSLPAGLVIRIEATVARGHRFEAAAPGS